MKLPVLVAVPLTLLLAACGGSSSPQRAADRPGASTTAPQTTTAPPAVGRPGATATATTSGSHGASASPTRVGSSASPAPGQPAEPSATAPGRYTYDSKGSIVAGGQSHDASGTQTLTVDPPSGANQHSSLGGDQGGGTQQDLVHRDTGTYLARLVISTGGSSKEFHPAQPVLGIPKPRQIGRTWSWTMTSTDGKTKAAYSGRFARTETLTIGGTKVETWVIESTLKLSGDFTYDDQETVNYDPSRLLEVRQRQHGSGSYSGIAFTSDVTSTLRSLRPS